MPSPLAGIARFPRARLGHAPTPVDAAPNLGGALGIGLYIKRDDCTGLAFGGNKVRQLEFHFGEARARGADTVLATGAVQSNLVRIAAAAARRLGMEIHIQIEDRVEGMDETYRASGNLLLDRVLGATLHPFPEGEDEAAADAAMERRAEAHVGGTLTASTSGINAELGYGLSLFGDRFTGTPNLGFGFSDTSRDYRIGWRLTSAVRGDPGFEINLDATRREAANGNEPPEHGAMLRAGIRW